MGIKYNEKTAKYEVSYGKRHPITRIPVSAGRIGIKSKAEAQRVHTQMVLQVLEKIHRDVVPNWKKMTESFLEEANNRGLTKNTIYDYSKCLAAYTFEAWGDRMVDTITTKEIRDLVLEKGRGRSPSHQKNILKFIRAVFNHIAEMGILPRSPVPQMKFQVGNKIKKVLTQDQVRTFLEKAKMMEIDWYPIWVMAVYTGMRSGELFALTWDKVNLADRLILVDTSWNNKDGFKCTKSGDDRMVEIAPTLLVMLKALKLQNSESPFVLPRVKKWDKGDQARQLRLFLTGIGLPIIRFHDLRATWATLLLSKGVEPIKVMKLGGWKDMKTMMIYIRKAGIDIKGTSDCLDLHNPAIESCSLLTFERK